MISSDIPSVANAFAAGVASQSRGVRRNSKFTTTVPVAVVVSEFDEKYAQSSPERKPHRQLANQFQMDVPSRSGYCSRLAVSAGLSLSSFLSCGASSYDTFARDSLV